MPCLALILLILICWCTPAPADTSVTLDSAPGFMVSSPTDLSHTLTLQSDFSYVDEAKFSGGLGSVSVSRASFSANYSIFRLTWETSHFSWLNKAHIARTLGLNHEVTPWDDLHDVTLQARILNNKLMDHWHYWVNGQLTSSFEETFPGAVGAGFDGGVSYEFWDGWMVGVSASTVALSPLNSDLFGNMEIGLVLGVSQKTLRNTLKSLGLMQDAGPGTDRIGLSFALTTSERTCRLNADNPLYSKGYVGFARSKVGVYLDYTPVDNLTLSIGPEYHYHRRYKLYNKAGSYKSSYSLDNAFGGYARILLRF